MGGSCYRVEGRELFFIGGWCENDCFQSHGGCEASAIGEVTKEHETCEISPPDHEMMSHTMAEANNAVQKATSKGKSIFLYTPDMFSDFYFDNCFNRLIDRNGATYISINAGVRTLTDRIGDIWQPLIDKGIKEMWIGVESADVNLRDKYNKPKFTNEEVLEITRKGRLLDINVCWFLVDGDEDTEATRLKTYNLIKQGEPFRIHIGDLKK